MKLTHATREAIRYACLNFHYAKAIPVNTIGYNVYNDSGEWCGVVLFGTGAAPKIGSPFGLVQGQVLELVRVALNGKQPCTSKVVSEALKQLKKDCPLCRLVVLYADCDQNHLGTIYQATNWIYIGRVTEGQSHSFLIDGKKIHEKSVRDFVLKRYSDGSIDNIKKAFHTDNVQKFYTQGKEKYLFPLDKQIRKKIEQLRKPYPKKDPNWTKIDRKQFKHEDNGND